MTFSIDNPEGGLQQPPLGKYVWEKPSGEQGLKPRPLNNIFKNSIWYIKYIGDYIYQFNS